MAKRKDKHKRYLSALGHKLISTWEELYKCKSDTHHIEPDIICGTPCTGWVYAKNKGIRGKEMHPYYLHTHTFYGMEYENSTKQLQKRGFKIVIDNWDK